MGRLSGSCNASGGRKFLVLGVRDHREIENLLEVRRVPEARLHRLAGLHGFDEPLVIGLDRRDLHLFPVAGLDIVAEADAQLAPVVPVLHLDAALLAVHAETKLVEVSRCPAGRMDDPERAVREIDRHREAVIGIEIVLADLHNALNFLGAITGETTSDQILGEIFSTFCIGK